MSKRYKKILLVRFLGYFFFLTGLVIFMAVFGPVAQAETAYRIDKLFGVKRILPNIVVSNEPGSSPEPLPSGGFADIQGLGEVIKPVSTDFGIVIEKINANAKVVANVDSGNEKDYIKALASGVAHAAGTNLPGEKGNIYLFSHSTDAPWNIVRFNAIFYLLRELEPGDRVVMFYQGKRFDYIVFDKNVVDPKDTSYLTNVYTDSVLTMQTCDPPGTTFRRLVVRAKLAGS